MRLNGVLIGLVTAGQAFGVSADIEWSVVYSAERLPDKDGWGASKGARTRAEITPDGLHLVDGGSQPTELHCYSRNWRARPERGAVIRATVKVVSCTDRSGMCIHASDGVHEDGLTLYPDRIRLSHADLEHAMDTTDGFHTYEMRISGLNIEVRVDGRVVIDGWGHFTAPAHGGRCVAMFGSVSSRSTGEAYWKEVRYAVSIVPTTRLEGARDVVVYRKEGVYACFPSLYRLADGRLCASFGTRVRRSHIDGTGGSARAISADDGETWTITEDRPPNPRFVRADGTTVVPHAQGWIYVSDDELPRVKESGRRWMRAREGTIAYLGDPQVRVTPADGESRIIELPNPAPGGVMSFHHDCSFHRAGKLWLTAIYGGLSADGPSGVWGIRSEDDGETWEVVTIADPRSAGRGFNETAVCDNGRGELIAVMRPKDERMNTYQCFSMDGGKTWTRPEDTGFWGYPCHLLLLEDGRLLCSRGYRRDAVGIRAALSRTGGHTWDVANDIVIRCDGQGNGSDNGYPISVQRADGRILSIYYINDAENITHVAGTIWDLPAAE